MPTSQAAGPGSLGILWSTRLVRTPLGLKGAVFSSFLRAGCTWDTCMETEMFLLEMLTHILAGTSLPLENPPAPVQCLAFWISTCFLPFLHGYQSFPQCRIMQEWVQGMKNTRVCVCRAVNNAICMKCSIWVCNKSIQPPEGEKKKAIRKLQRKRNNQFAHLQKGLVCHCCLEVGR